MPRRLVVFDTETANAGLAMHLLELGAVAVEDGEVVDHFQSLVRPEIPIDARTSEVHGIVDADVVDAEPASVVVPRFLAWMGDCWLAAHNAPFDVGVLGYEAARHGLALPARPVLDTLKLARRHIGESVDHKLETLVQHLDLDIDEHHRALSDATAAWLVVEECLARRAAEADAPAGESLWAEFLHHGASRRDLAQALPRAPRLSPRLRPLEAACRARAEVLMHYGEGEGGLALMRVLPRLLFESGEKGYLEAECLRSGMLKTYRLDRVRRIEE